MREIISKYEKERARKRNHLIVGGVLIFVMISGIIGYSFQGRITGDATGKESINYNGYEFIKQNGFWTLGISNINFVFTYNPNQTEDTKISITKTVNDYSGKPLYINSEDAKAEYEIHRNLNQFVLRTQSACLKGEKCENENWPIKTCDDNFIIIKEANSSEIIQQDNCVFIKGKKDDLIKLTDSFLFEIFGIN